MLNGCEIAILGCYRVISPTPLRYRAETLCHVCEVANFSAAEARIKIIKLHKTSDNVASMRIVGCAQLRRDYPVSWLEEVLLVTLVAHNRSVVPHNNRMIDILNHALLIWVDIFGLRRGVVVASRPCHVEESHFTLARPTIVVSQRLHCDTQLFLRGANW